jgi:hypothetical protein
MAGKSGRPPKPKDQVRNQTLIVRLTAAEYSEILMATPAEYLRVNQSEWIRKVLLYVARNDIRIT